jgi:hypothetical protein
MNLNTKFNWKAIGHFYYLRNPYNEHIDFKLEAARDGTRD